METLDEYLAFLAMAWKNEFDARRAWALHSGFPGSPHETGARLAVVSKELGLRPEDVLKAKRRGESDEEFQERVLKIMRRAEQEYKALRKDYEQRKKSARGPGEKQRLELEFRQRLREYGQKVRRRLEE